MRTDFRFSAHLCSRVRRPNHHSTTTRRVMRVITTSMWTISVKQASHWHKFCFHATPQYGVPSVTHKLRPVHEMRDTECHACALNSLVVVTSRDTCEIKHQNVAKLSPRHGTHHFTWPRILTQSLTSSSLIGARYVKASRQNWPKWQDVGLGLGTLWPQAFVLDLEI